MQLENQNQQPLQPTPPGQPTAVPSSQPQAGQTIPANQVNNWIDNRPQGGPTIEPPKSRLGLKITLAIVGALVVVGGIIGYVVFKPSDGTGIEIVITAPDTITRGTPIEVTINVANDSGNPLKDAHIGLTLPEEIIFVGIPGASKTVENRTIGTLESGAVHKESFMIMATGPENTVRQLQASLSYIPGVLSSRFEKTVTKDIVLGAAGVDISVGLPTKVLSNEEFEVTIAYKNTTEKTFDDVQLAVKYPNGFTLRSADKPTLDEETNNLWSIGSFKPGDTATTTLKGSIVGQENAVFEFNTALSAIVGEARYDIGAGSASVTLSPSPLSVKISLENGDQQVLDPGASLRYRLTYTNNTDISLRDVIVRATLIGEMFDLKTLKTEGALRSSDNTIVWNASRAAELAALTPGATGVVSFTINAKPTYTITRLSSKNYTLTVKAEAESPTVPRGVSADKTVGISQLTNKMRGVLNFASVGYYRDAASGIANNGVFPPVVGKPTQFTIHWVLKNTSTDVEKISMKAFLGPNVRYTGQYKSTTETGPSYNDRTQEITWGVPKIAATKGTLSQPVELIFQVELTPGPAQVDQYPTLVGEVTGIYTDMFTAEDRTFRAGEVTLNLPADQTLGNVDKRVKAQ